MRTTTRLPSASWSSALRPREDSQAIFMGYARFSSLLVRYKYMLMNASYRDAQQPTFWHRRRDAL